MLRAHCWPLLLLFMKTYGPKEHLMWLPPPCLSSTISPALIPALIYSTPQDKWCLLSSGVLSLTPPVTRDMQWQFLTRNGNRQHFHQKTYHPLLSIFYWGWKKHFAVTMQFFLSALCKDSCALLKKVCISRKRLWRLIHAQAKLFSPPWALSLALFFQLV